jgi:hypothetical protein
VFVERSGKRKRLEGALLASSRQESPIASMAVDAKEKPAESQRLKRPGLATKAKKKVETSASGETSKKTPELPQSLMRRLDVDMDQLARDMDAYTLEQISLNLSRMEEDKKSSDIPAKRPSTVSPSKYKPKAPAQRYAERHPESTGPQGGEDVSMEPSDNEESDYVIETYIRVPAMSLAEAVPPEQIGLLVFDTEPDIEFFYGAESDSDGEVPEDDEDSNGKFINPISRGKFIVAWRSSAVPAEDYYTADYPDDEVASDDEFGYNPYKYRTGNASDLEEFDETKLSDIEDGVGRLRPSSAQ